MSGIIVNCTYNTLYMSGITVNCTYNTLYMSGITVNCTTICLGTQGGVLQEEWPSCKEELIMQDSSTVVLLVCMYVCMLGYDVSGVTGMYDVCGVTGMYVCLVMMFVVLLVCMYAWL